MATHREPQTMYSTSRGPFRDALDRWRERMSAAAETKNREEQKRLAIVVEKIALRWLNGDDHDALADALALEIDS